MTRRDLLRYEDHGDIVWWTSDASAAYLIDNDHITKVLRTVVFARPDVVVVIDQIRLHFGEQPISARFFPDNRDGAAELNANGERFLIKRPAASLYGSVSSRGTTSIATAKLDVTPETGDFPFIEVSSPPSFSHELVTVLRAVQSGKKPRKFEVTATANGWQASGRNQKIAIDTRNITPVIALS